MALARIEGAFSRAIHTLHLKRVRAGADSAPFLKEVLAARASDRL